ncbi:MAG: hypothetical protein OQK75_06290 [Gammaproteobacteria bacterium]|nr:hypothetical protein [Gammaproteobacteria bacterium]MCW8987265.1 hypothetical protein [Gammaproteobacteria bacterium]
MKDILIDMMVAMMPFMKPVMWVGIVVATIGLLFVIANIVLKMDTQKTILWSVRIALTTAVFFLVAQVAGYFLNMPPTVNFGDSTKFEFILVSFWQIGASLLAATLIIKYLASINVSHNTPA